MKQEIWLKAAKSFIKPSAAQQVLAEVGCVLLDEAPSHSLKDPCVVLLGEEEDGHHVLSDEENVNLNTGCHKKVPN